MIRGWNHTLTLSTAVISMWWKNEKELVGKKTLSDFATGHMYFGLHRTDKGWTFREWAPNATEIYLVGDFNDWQEKPAFRMKRVRKTGNWENQSAGKGHEARRLVQAESVLGRRMR